MLLKKPALLVCFSSVPAGYSPPSITSSCGPRPTKPRRQPTARDKCQRATYATVHHGNDLPPSHKPKEAPRTHQWPTTPRPTPYEILGQQKGAPYSKKVFYDLVKIYHPDLHHTHHSNDSRRTNDKLARLVRLERYRLIVNANNILSDPTRRRAYDLYGAGWGDHADTKSHSPGADRAWRGEPNNASMNATWEDWERWHARRAHAAQANGEGGDNGSGGPQEPIYTSNGGFVIGVLMFIAVSGYAQSVRAGYGAMNMVALRDEKDAAISQAMRQRELETAGLSRDGRVENFLRQRDGLFEPVERCNVQGTGR